MLISTLGVSSYTDKLHLRLSLTRYESGSSERVGTDLRNIVYYMHSLYIYPVGAGKNVV
jgi:hypothetical protein